MCYSGKYTITSILIVGQVLRSCSTWSAGQDLTEHSIQKALVDAITTARHYVYIENQFFISYVKGGAGGDQWAQVAS